MSRMLKAFLFVLLLQWAPAKGADVEGIASKEEVQNAEKKSVGDAETLKVEVDTEGSQGAEEEEKGDDQEEGEDKDEEEDEENREEDEVDGEEKEEDEGEEDDEAGEREEEDDEEGEETEDHAEDKEQTGSLSHDQIVSIIKKHDKDQDGKLSLFELLQIYHEEDDQPHDGERDSTHGLEDAFHKVDADQDGLLNTDEMMSLTQLLSQEDDERKDDADAEEDESDSEDEEDEDDAEFTEEERDMMMREHDANKDGRLSFAEISQAFLEDKKVPSQIDESAPNPVIPVQLEQSFDKANANKDAGLDKYELMGFMTLLEESDL